MIFRGSSYFESELFQHIHRGRNLPGLGLAANFKVELLKDLAELLWRVDVELLSRQLEDLFGEPREFLFHLASRFVERGQIDANADSLHVEQYLDQRQLDLAIDRVQLHLFDLAAQDGRQLQREVRGLKRARSVLVEAFDGLGHLEPEEFAREFLRPVVGTIRIEQVSGDQRVVFNAFDANRRSEILNAPVAAVRKSHQRRVAVFTVAHAAVERSQRAFPIVNRFANAAVLQHLFQLRKRVLFRIELIEVDVRSFRFLGGQRDAA